MRQVTRYPATLKESLLAKMLAPNGATAVELSKEYNIPYGTLITWINMSKKHTVTQVNTPLRPVDQTAETKLRAVLDTIDKTETERAAYCREHGFYLNHLDEWKEQMLTGLGAAKPKKDKIEHQQLTHENKKLKSDLNRKDKALAEVSALLILKKKADLLWGEKKDD